MPITFTHELDNTLLRIKAQGRDDSLEDARNYGMAVIALAREHGSKAILCDESELVYSLGTFDLFELAKALAAAVPKVIKVALIVHPSQIQDAVFWETVGVNRSARVRVFKDTAGAEAWIQSTADPG